MLMKLFDTSDYDRSLRRRRWAALGLLAVGITGLACYALLIHDSQVLSDYARGFYLGAASGITAGALALLIRTQYLMTHPKAQRKAKIKETDEREMHITRSAAQIAGGLTIFGVVLSLFIVLPLSMEAYYALTGVVFFYTAVFFLSSLWLSKKL